MSVQFGQWSFDGKPADGNHLDKVRSAISSYGLDGGESYIKDGTCILYYAFHTTKESRRQSQPYIYRTDTVITWDGRLDNAADLARDLGDALTLNPSEIEIVAAAYERWGTKCFARFIGDWALGIWNPRTQSLILAKDFVGIRQLYYSIDKDQISWSTLLDPLVLFSGRNLMLSEEYVAGWFSFFPAAHLTPYVDIQSVPPASFVSLGPRRHTIQRYWDFDPAKRTFYTKDADYDEHFRVVFREAVRRRLCSDTPVIAELSGGMDSSSIVCMADDIIAREGANTQRLDTVSFYNDSEPNWNERPYFTLLEQKRGRPGVHINASSERMFDYDLDGAQFEATPECTIRRVSESSTQFSEFAKGQGSRVVLSGFGGDEVMGGVPTPTPELQDLLATAQLRELGHQLKGWALDKRDPWIHLLVEAVRGFYRPNRGRPTAWLNPDFIKRNRPTFEGYENSLKFFGPLPSFLTNVYTFNQLRRQLACHASGSEPRYEKRYPYLDRDLLEFAYSIPRSQMVLPGRRRYLMRRALVGLVPEAILERKRKASVTHSPMVALSSQRVSRLSQNMKISSLGLVDENRFLEILQKARISEQVPLPRVFRTLFVEMWLRNVSQYGISMGFHQKSPETGQCLSTRLISAEKH